MRERSTSPARTLFWMPTPALSTQSYLTTKEEHFKPLQYRPFSSRVTLGKKEAQFSTGRVAARVSSIKHPKAGAISAMHDPVNA